MQQLNTLFFLLCSGLVLGQAPTDAPAAPTRPAETVISLYSDAYDDTVVDTYRTDWSVGTLTETEIAGNNVLAYDGLGYVGIEMTGDNAHDLTAAGITTLHYDYWSPNVNSFRFKLVDWGSDGFDPQGNNTESEVGRGLPQGEWVGVDLPLGLFNGMNYTDINQIVISTVPNEGGTVYLDNIYFYSGGATIGATPLDLPVTFEEEDVTYGLSDFAGAVSEVVIDPTDATNHVAQTIKTAGAETYAGTTVTLDKGGSPNDPGFATAIPFTADATTISVRVWSPAAGTPVRLKVENSTDPTVSVETEVTTEVAMTWDTLVFDFATEATGTAALSLGATYNKLTIFFDFGTQPAEAATYYWDDVYFGGASTGGGGGGGGASVPMVAAPTPTYPSDSVLSLFSEAYDDVTVDTWRTDWSAASYSEIMVDGNAVKAYGNLDFVGIETVGENALDLSGYDYLHIDYWSSDLDTFRIKLVDFGMDGFDNGTDTEYEIPFEITKGEWVGLDVPMSDFLGMKLTDINQIILSALPTAGGTLYIDNFYFFKGATTAVREAVIGTLGAFPNPVGERVTLSAPSRMKSLQLYDATGRLVSEFRPGSERFDLPMGGLRAGLYVAVANTAEGRLTVRLRKN